MFFAPSVFAHQSVNPVVCASTNRNLRADLGEAEERLAAELDAELARVKAELEEAGQDERRLLEEDRSLTEELVDSDAKLRALRLQVDQLTQEIKQANLQSLSIAPVDEVKIHLEGNTCSITGGFAQSLFAV